MIAVQFLCTETIWRFDMITSVYMNFVRHALFLTNPKLIKHDIKHFLSIKSVTDRRF